MEPQELKKCGVVALLGRPNAGKSTLLNQLLETTLSIVSPKAQTTRDRIHGVLTEEAGQIIFVDTPGVHRAKKGGVNEYMVTEAKAALDAPQLIWYLVDPESNLQHEKTVLDTLEGNPAPVFLLLNKVDIRAIRRHPEVLDELEQTMTHEMEERKLNLKKTFRVSARKSEGLAELMEASWEYLPQGPFLYPEDELSDRPMRFFVGEKIREQLFLNLGDELPYSCAVSIDLFNENSDPIHIEATIHVERDSQKGIVS